jgi:hypothetical protein
MRVAVYDARRTTRTLKASSVREAALRRLPNRTLMLAGGKQ